MANQQRTDKKLQGNIWHYESFTYRLKKNVAVNIFFLNKSWFVRLLAEMPVRKFCRLLLRKYI